MQAFDIGRDRFYGVWSSFESLDGEGGQVKRHW